MISNIVKHISPSKQLFTNNLKLYLGSATQVRHKNKAFIARPKPLPNIRYEAMEKSLKQKGYHRAQDSYTPPDNVREIIQKLKHNISSGIDGKPFTVEDKFNILSLCSNELKHTVPNSVIHEMNTIDDVIAFYETPINAFLPLDELTTRKLPPNLHIEHNYTRFNPETDKMFGGHTAFPQSSTIVTGIKYRKKYPGYDATKRHI